jgi:WD40 repeat protein
VATLGWSPDNTQIVSSSRYGTIIFWALADLHPQAYLQVDDTPHAISWGHSGIVVAGLTGLAVFDLR